MNMAGCGAQPSTFLMAFKTATNTANTISTINIKDKTMVGEANRAGITMVGDLI